MVVREEGLLAAGMGRGGIGMVVAMRVVVMALRWAQRSRRRREDTDVQETRRYRRARDEKDRVVDGCYIRRLEHVEEWASKGTVIYAESNVCTRFPSCCIRVQLRVNVSQ